MSDIAAIDIGSYEVKFGEASFKKDSLIIEKLGSVYNPTGSYLPDKDEHLTMLASAIKQAFKEYKIKPKNLWACLPESLAYTNIISMPQLSDAELASSVHWEAEQHIPVPVDDLHLEYEVLYRPPKKNVGEKMKVLLVGAKKTDVSRLVDLMHLAGLELIGLETCLLSIYRVLASMFGNSGAYVVVHMGALSTDILIVENGGIMLAYSAQTGGLALTKAIQHGLNLTPSQAEEYKRAYGMDPNQLEGKLRGSLEGVLKLVVAEVRKAIQYYQSSKMMSPIQGMVVSGGSAYLPGINTYLAQIFGVEVVTANPFSFVDVAKLDNASSLLAAIYTPTIGLLHHRE